MIWTEALFTPGIILLVSVTIAAAESGDILAPRSPVTSLLLGNNAVVIEYTMKHDDVELGRKREYWIREYFSWPRYRIELKQTEGEKVIQKRFLVFNGRDSMSLDLLTKEGIVSKGVVKFPLPRTLWSGLYGYETSLFHGRALAVLSSASADQSSISAAKSEVLAATVEWPFVVPMVLNGAKNVADIQWRESAGVYLATTPKDETGNSAAFALSRVGNKIEIKHEILYQGNQNTPLLTETASYELVLKDGVDGAVAGVKSLLIEIKDSQRRLVTDTYTVVGVSFATLEPGEAQDYFEIDPSLASSIYDMEAKKFIRK